MTDAVAPPPPGELAGQVRRAVIWRSGSQIVAQTVAWSSTFLVIRLLDPSDYGLFAMTQVILVLLNLLNGYGLASALVRAKEVDDREVRQVMGLLMLLNGALAVAQFAAAPLIAAYYRQPMVADLLRVQCLLYFATPFIALPQALLSRGMDFRRPAQVRLVSALAGAITALACAYAGWGVWTLVAAPMVMFWCEAAGMSWAAGGIVRPLFRFDGAGEHVRYGGTMMLVQFFWFLQSQADVFIAGRVLDPHHLGLYTTALLLTQMLATKFVPPLNEVAFAAYARMGGERDAMGASFVRTARVILLVVCPAYAGLAVTARPLVSVVLGAKWIEAAAVVPILALAMPLLTLQVLFAPATNALGRPGVALRASIAGGLVLPIAFLVGIHWGVIGLSWAWVGGMVLLLAATATLSLPAIGVGPGRLLRAVAPGVLAAAAMAAIVVAMDRALPPLGDLARLAALVAVGAGSYLALLAIGAPRALGDARALIRGR